MGGLALVTPGGPGVFGIALGGTLSGFNQSLMTAAVTTGPGSIGVVETTAGAGGTVIADGASLQLAGSFTVAGEPLLIQGDGGGATPTVPTQWFQVGPSPIANGQTPGSQTTTGRINATVVDPRDSNIIYVATAGGGAWKTIDGGKTWRPIFDAIPEIQTVTVNLATGTFTLTFNGETTVAINAASPTLAADIQAALNSLPSIGGVGGIRDRDEGRQHLQRHVRGYSGRLRRPADDRQCGYHLREHGAGRQGPQLRDVRRRDRDRSQRLEHHLRGDRRREQLDRFVLRHGNLQIDRRRTDLERAHRYRWPEQPGQPLRRQGHLEDGRRPVVTGRFVRRQQRHHRRAQRSARNPLDQLPDQ